MITVFLAWASKSAQLAMYVVLRCLSLRTKKGSTHDLLVYGKNGCQKKKKTRTSRKKKSRRRGDHIIIIRRVEEHFLRTNGKCHTITRSPALFSPSMPVAVKSKHIMCTH